MTTTEGDSAEQLAITIGLIRVDGMLRYDEQEKWGIGNTTVLVCGQCGRGYFVPTNYNGIYACSNPRCEHETFWQDLETDVGEEVSVTRDGRLCIIHVLDDLDEPTTD